MIASKKKKLKTSIIYFSTEQKRIFFDISFCRIRLLYDNIKYYLVQTNILLFRRRILPRKKYLQKDFQVRYRKLKQAKGSATYYLILINNSDCEQKSVILISWKNINFVNILPCLCCNIPVYFESVI